MPFLWGTRTERPFSCSAPKLRCLIGQTFFRQLNAEASFDDLGFISKLFFSRLDFKKKDNLLIYQSQINPPHYKVILEDDTWDVPKVGSSQVHLHPFLQIVPSLPPVSDGARFGPFWKAGL